MKLATLRNGARDGVLVVVSRDLTRYCPAQPIAPTLQAALDEWPRLAPKLGALARDLEIGAAPSFRFREHEALSPLPRAYKWADGSAFVNHVELLRRAHGDAFPASFRTDPLIYQGGSDAFLAPRESIVMASEDFGVDFEGEVAVIIGDVPAGCGRAEAAEAIRLVLLVNDVSLRNLAPGEAAKGFGFFQSKPSPAFSPVAATPDELGPAWDGGKAKLPLLVTLNGKPFGRPDAGVDMAFDFPALIAHAARTRPVGAGAIVGSGTVSNRSADGEPARPIDEGGVGYACIAERRAVETILEGKPKTPHLKFGDVVRIEMKDAGGRSIFGAIEQSLERYAP